MVLALIWEIVFQAAFAWLTERRWGRVILYTLALVGVAFIVWLFVTIAV